ncbi:MAG: LytTR family DNA-binding domain-containing protein [Novosphingobium sp.]|uniref:LytTR family DNA-binding domain-containing protein n=1 Tax=Novosphingobium sp. TaxID=1874826 RepID=UPI003C7EBB32
MTTPQPRAALRKMVIDLSIMTGLGVLLALVGPFGTFNLPFALRLVYWVVLGLGGYACYRPIASAAIRLGQALDLPEAAAWVAACLIATVPMTLIVWTVGGLSRPFALPSLDTAITQYGYVLVIGGMVTGVFYLFERRAPTTAAPIIAAAGADAGDAPEPQPRFLERIPHRLGPDLIALQMEDHYLRIHTRLGSDLILMRMRDAVAELDGIDGAQVHRSWWVARSAVTRTERDGRSIKLMLDGGLEVPVSRDAAADLKAAGWL